MVKKGDVVGYKKNNNFKNVVLENLLRFASEQYNFELVKLPSTKVTKIAVADSIDSEAGNVVNSLIKGNAVELKKDLPVKRKIIKPLYLFLDEEIILYARLKKLGFSRDVLGKKNKIENLLDELEKKHPEVKRAVVNSLLEMYR